MKSEIRKALGIPKRKFTQTYNGEWFTPRKRGWRMRCCKCGLVHKVNFKLVPHGRGKKIRMQVWRLKRNEI